MWWLFIIFGALGGVIGGMGMGGGTVLIPLLTIFLDVDQKLAQGLNLMSFLIMAIITLVIHEKNHMIEKKGILPIILSGLIFAGLGAFLASLVSSEILRILFGVFLIILSVFEFVKVFKKEKPKKSKIK